MRVHGIKLSCGLMRAYGAAILGAALVGEHRGAVSLNLFAFRWRLFVTVDVGA